MLARHTFAAGIMMILLSGAALAQSTQSITVLSKSGNSTTIQVTPDSTGVDTVTTGGVKGLKLVYRDVVTEFNTGDNYVREFIPVQVGVFSKQVRVQVLQTDYRTVEMMAPYRSPSFPAQLKPNFVTQFVSYNPPYDQRKHFVAMIRVYPYSFDSTSGSYQLLSRVVFQVTSVGSGVMTKNMPTDLLLSGSLVNYDQVKNAVVAQPTRLFKTTTSGVLSQGTWYKMSVYRTGIYKLTYDQLKAAGVPVDGVGLNTIKIYDNGGTMLPEDPNAPRPGDLTENAIYVYDANGNGTFGPNDYILFYGRGTKGWSYDSLSNTFSHYINNYSDTNYYFITWGGQQGKRMQVVPSFHAAAYYRPQSYTSGVFQDTSMYNLLNSGQDWYGPQLVPPNSTGGNSSYLYQNTLYGLDHSRDVTYRLALISRSTDGSYNYFTVYENSTGTQLGTIVGGTVTTTGDFADQGDYAYPIPVQTFSGTGNLPNDKSSLEVAYNSTSASAQGYIDWIEILYHRYFQSVGDVLDFYEPDTTANVYYSVNGFSSDSVNVFDVTNFANVGVVHPDSVNNGTVYFGTQASSGSRKEFYAVGDNGYLSVQAIVGTANSNLHGDLNGADLIIVTAPQFLLQADELASWKESHDALSTQVVTTTQVYNEFGCGIPDPTAIRDFLKYAYTNDQLTPSYVILFGSGTYDYKGIAAKDTEFVPPYESQESLNQVNSYCSDDYYVEFNGPLTQTPISMSIGRLSAHDAADADAVVNKIRLYETSTDFGTWRNLITLVADDDVTTGIANDIGSPSFTSDTQFLEQYIPSQFDLKQIYIALYPTVVSTSGRRKPQAASDIINQINQGTLMMNFVGHGAFDLWSYAHVFEAPVSVPQLTNLNKLTLFVTATCDFGLDDNPQEESGAELLVNSPIGGAIGCLSATRVGYEGDNSLFDNTFFGDLLVWNAQRVPPRIGDAVFETKQALFSLADAKYNYTGDPTVRLAVPRYEAVIDSLNGQSLAQLQEIKALEKLDIKGSVLKADGTLWSDLADTGIVTIYDSDKPVLIPQWNLSYNFPGSILYRGQISIQNGEFEAQALIPKDISYSGEKGKIELYFGGGGADGLGYTRNVIVGGTDTTAANNHIAPVIDIYFDSRNFRDGDVVSANPTMIVDIHAVNGLNLSDAAIGHSLQATFDGQQSVNLAPYYTGKLNSYQDGTVEYPVTTDLSYGEHSVTIQAFDAFNNEAQASATFDVESNSTLSITNVYNYPDPFSSGTAFTFERSDAGGAGEPVNVTVKVFTISGRLIRTIHAYGLTGTFVRIDWNGLDEDGDRLANGVYLYKVIATTIDGQYTSSAIGRMAVVR